MAIRSLEKWTVCSITRTATTFQRRKTGRSPTCSNVKRISYALNRYKGSNYNIDMSQFQEVAGTLSDHTVTAACRVLSFCPVRSKINDSDRSPVWYGQRAYFLGLVTQFGSYGPTRESFWFLPTCSHVDICVCWTHLKILN